MTPPDADGLQAGRVAENEEAFRRLNEHIRGRWAHFMPSRLQCASYVCECSDENCATHVQLTDGEYRHARADADRFLIAPQHNTSGQERVVERHDRYWLVEKAASAVLCNGAG
jgi:hypothetical protein